MKQTKGRHEGVRREDIDGVVDNQIERTIEQLEEHVPPTLAHYENFLKNELSWIEQEKKTRESLAAQLPG